jgi:hypothetical protein
MCSIASTGQSMFIDLKVPLLTTVMGNSSLAVAIKQSQVKIRQINYQVIMFSYTIARY